MILSLSNSIQIDCVCFQQTLFFSGCAHSHRQNITMICEDGNGVFDGLERRLHVGTHLTRKRSHQMP